MKLNPIHILLLYILAICAFTGALVAKKRIDQMQRHIDYIHDELNKKAYK